MIKRRYIYFGVLAILIIIGFFIFKYTGHASEGSAISSVSISGLRILYFTFNGSTTDFYSLNLSELENLSSITLEKTAYGKVVFLEEVNLSLVGGVDGIVNFDRDLNISDNLISVDSSELPFLNKSVLITLYGLSFTTPQIMKGSEICSDCTLIEYYSNGTLIFNSSIFSDAYYVIETPVSPVCGNGVCEDGETVINCPSDCSSGGGGGGGDDQGEDDDDQGEDDEYSFYLVPDFFVSELKKGSYYQKEIIIVNNGTKDLEIGIGVQDLGEFVFPSVNSISVPRGENRSIRLNIYASNYVVPDVYVGKILFRNYKVSKEIRTILDVQERYALFDIRAEILKRYVTPGGRVLANVSIVNMGDLRDFDVSLEYKVMDFNNLEYVLKKEDFAINQSFQRVLFLDLPEDISIGNYLFYVRVNYTDIGASAYDTFTVEKISWLSWLFLILSILIILIVLFVRLAKYKGWWWFAAAKRRRDEEREKEAREIMRGNLGLERVKKRYGLKDLFRLGARRREISDSEKSLIELARSKGI